VFFPLTIMIANVTLLTALPFFLLLILLLFKSVN
jgi:hypothetical protein